MTGLWLLRHGPTEAGLRGAPLGRLDLPVTPAGRDLWPRVKDQLLGLGCRQVLTSDLARARAAALDLGLPCRILPDLGEQAFGAWDGVPWAEIRGAEAFFADPARTAPPGGESFAQCAERSVAALEAAWDPALPTLVLAHGGPLRAILAQLLGLAPERALDLAWRPYGLSRLDPYPGGRAVLRYHNLPLPCPEPAGGF